MSSSHPTLIDHHVDHRIDPRTATPCRTVAFSSDESTFAEANYLGFVTTRDAETGRIRRRFLAQTALVETVRFEPATGALLMVGAGFEGGRDFGAVKIVDPRTGRRLAELRGHSDDATDVIGLSGPRRRIVSVGLDRKVIVHDVEDPTRNWIWSDYEDYLNTCAERPRHPGHIAVAGDSAFTYVLDCDARTIVAKLESPGDCNGLAWSEDGRFAIVADDHGRALYFDADKHWKLVGEAKVGGAAKRMVVDPADTTRILTACYDGRIWSIARRPDGDPPKIVVDRRLGIWGINVAATRTRIAVPSFFDRAYLFERGADGRPTRDLGEAPQPTYGCNWVAVRPNGHEIAVTHDDGRVRIRDAETGALLRSMGPDTESLYMGAAFHPRLPLLATIDFHGEVVVYDVDRGVVVWRREMAFGPGISVDFSPDGRHLAVGGYSWRGRVIAFDDEGRPTTVTELPAQSRGVLKNVAFASSTRLLAAAGDGHLLVWDLSGDHWTATRAIRGTPHLELANGVAASPDGKTGYIVARDQTVRAFDLDSGRELASGLAHVRGVKTIHVSDDGKTIATGAYDRTVLIWSADDLSVRVPPIRHANSGVSGVRVDRGRVFSCSFDGVVSAIDAATGSTLWIKTSADAAEAR